MELSFPESVFHSFNSRLNIYLRCSNTILESIEALPQILRVFSVSVSLNYTAFMLLWEAQISHQGNFLSSEIISL